MEVIYTAPVPFGVLQLYTNDETCETCILYWYHDRRPFLLASSLHLARFGSSGRLARITLSSLQSSPQIACGITSCFDLFVDLSQELPCPASILHKYLDPIKQSITTHRQETRSRTHPSAIIHGPLPILLLREAVARPSRLHVKGRRPWLSTSSPRIR